MNRNRPVRIANCSGFYGDRMAALQEQVQGGEIDVITGDYLAEVTMLILAKSRAKHPEQGYARTFVRQLSPVLSDVAEREIKVVVNAGGLNPSGLASELRKVIEDHGVSLGVAYVEGDDVSARVDELMAAGHELVHLDTGEPLSSWGHTPICANAYLGGFGVSAALGDGADIVVTGRVADASVVSGAAAWWWGWGPEDYDELAGSIAAGHVIECGAQATGGNFSGFRDVAGLEHPGFPIAEIAQDGSSVITKHDDTGGAVTIDTVTAQLLYEIGDPAYLNPDVITHLDAIELKQESSDRVTIAGVRGSPPPSTTKVSICAIDGWRNASTYVLTGEDIEAKADLVERTVRSRLVSVDGIEEVRFTRVGMPADDPADQFLGSCLLHIAVRGDEQSAGRRFSSALVEMGLSSYPGLYSTGAPGGGTSRGVYWPALLEMGELEHAVVHASGRREVIAPPARSTAVGPGEPAGSSPTGVQMGDVEMRPLGAVANARSGDKGGNANVGVWAADDDAFRWLDGMLTVERFRELVPESADLQVDRYRLPNLHALNFVVRGLLDGGAAGTLRFDSQAKALGEWIRARHVPVPTKLLEGMNR